MEKSKNVKVSPYKRTPPKSPPYKGKGNKPGPKTVAVDKHKKSKPSS